METAAAIAAMNEDLAVLDHRLQLTKLKQAKHRQDTVPSRFSGVTAAES